VQNIEGDYSIVVGFPAAPSVDGDPDFLDLDMEKNRMILPMEHSGNGNVAH
jgi:hypothetical protein